MPTYANLFQSDSNFNKINPIFAFSDCDTMVGYPLVKLLKKY